jgi:hypothetical protein
VNALMTTQSGARPLSMADRLIALNGDSRDDGRALRRQRDRWTVVCALAAGSDAAQRPMGARSFRLDRTSPVSLSPGREGVWGR